MTCVAGGSKSIIRLVVALDLLIQLPTRALSISGLQVLVVVWSSASWDTVKVTDVEERAAASSRGDTDSNPRSAACLLWIFRAVLEPL